MPTSSNNTFADKVVLITGATAGIGRATAVAFARQGAKVVLERVGTLTRRILPIAWRGAALHMTGRPHDVRTSMPSGHKMSQQAAPANNPTRCSSMSRV